MSNCKVFARIIRTSCADFSIWPMTPTLLIRVDRFERFHRVSAIWIEIQWILREIALVLPQTLSWNWSKKRLLYRMLMQKSIQVDWYLPVSAGYENPISFQLSVVAIWTGRRTKSEKRPPCACSSNATHFHSLHVLFYLVAIRCFSFQHGLWMWHAAVVNVIIITIRHICKLFLRQIYILVLFLMHTEPGEEKDLHANLLPPLTKNSNKIKKKLTIFNKTIKWSSSEWQTDGHVRN